MGRARSCQAHLWAGPSGVQHLKLAGDRRQVSSGSKGGTVGLITFTLQMQGKGDAGTQVCREAWLFPAQNDGKNTSHSLGLPSRGQHLGLLAYCYWLSDLGEVSFDLFALPVGG